MNNKQQIDDCKCKGSCSCQWEDTLRLAIMLGGDSSQSAIDKAYAYIDSYGYPLNTFCHGLTISELEHELEQLNKDAKTMNKIKCPTCYSTNIEATYSTDILVNDMTIDDDGSRYCETTDHYLDGDFSEHLVCLECSNTFKCEEWTMKTATTVNATFTLPTSFPGIVDLGGESVESLKKEYLAMVERSLEIEVTAEWRNGEKIK